MKAATLAQLKKELKEKPANELLDICVRMAKFKKDNKELLSYLIFDASDERGYIKQAKEELEEAFDEINTGSLYWAKKGLRKVLRNLKKQIKYSGDKVTEVELLMHFCKLLREFSIPYHDYVTLLNMYEGQMNRVRTVIKGLHEDLQYDYNEMLRSI